MIPACVVSYLLKLCGSSATAASPPSALPLIASFTHHVGTGLITLRHSGHQVVQCAAYDLRGVVVGLLGRYRVAPSQVIPCLLSLYVGVAAFRITCCPVCTGSASCHPVVRCQRLTSGSVSLYRVSHSHYAPILAHPPIASTTILDYFVPLFHPCFQAYSAGAIYR